MGVAERAFLNRRRSPRSPVLLPACVVTISAYQYFELIDLSATGAKLRGSRVPPFGKTALFRLDGFQSLCKVIWAADELCGVHFDEPIPAGILLHFQDAGRPERAQLLTSDDQVDEKASAG